MITGVHAIIFTPDAEADRAFFSDVLDLPVVDAGGWPIFAVPPAEQLPSGGALALYEPRHPSPLSPPEE